MEEIFNLTAEQTQAVQALRDEYEAEKKKLELEIALQQKALAEKAAQLRLKFEQRANELLTGADKEAKVKLDAIGREANAKTVALVTEGLKIYDPEDLGQGLALIRMIRDKTHDIFTETEEKILALIPADTKAKIEEALRHYAAERNQMDRMIPNAPPGPPPGPGGQGGQGRPPREQGGDPNPPKPPEGARNF
jgi:hypothetical protein